LAAPEAPLLEVRGACRRFGERAALDGLDLAARPGELLALLGPNGAGKTTLLRAICGRLALDQGRISVGGRDPRRDPAARALVGLVPQAIALYGGLSVRANLAIFARLSGVSGRRVATAVDAALAWSGLRERADDAVRELSGGMQRRVNIAAGTLHEPALLLLDEPTVGLDPSVRGAIHEVLRSLRQRGMAIVMTTHDLHEAGDLADRVAFVTGGRVRAEGVPAALVGEVFAGASEVRLLLREPPGPALTGVLARAGLLGTGQARLWVGALAGGMGELGALRELLDHADVPVAELRLREPGLDSVFLRLTGQALR
jgi:ABC-2 type transport system ATP-binding protein